MKPAAAQRHAGSLAERLPSPVDVAERPLKALQELNVVCNQIGADGSMKFSSGRVSKAELCASHGILPRDLRRLDGTLKNQHPAILVRREAILVNLDYVKAVIKRDCVILFESMDLSERPSQVAFVRELRDRIRQSRGQAVPFEFVVLEAILMRICTSLQEEFEAILQPVEDCITDFERYVHWEKLRKLLNCKRRINRIKTKVDGIKATIAEVLNSDMDMSQMYLSSNNACGPRPVSAHEEIELLLESYLKIADEVASRVEELGMNMESTHDTVNIGLMGQRNELLLLELKLTIGTFATSMGGFGASLFGMNLLSHWESHGYAFYMVTGGLAGAAMGSFVLAWRRMKRLVRKK